MSTRQAETVQRVTSAPEAGHVDRDARFVRYAWQMGIRTVCFILAFVTTGWVQVVLFIAAIVLPYIAVVLANSGAAANGEALPPVPTTSEPELAPRRELPAGSEIIQGTTTDDVAEPGRRLT
ncbi:DUF3099 domain-containing protein [Citricoccus sp. GCM10030269]|uniref:DUF3099 domain-containing protein n=1 Tax=Citricoccus sp. GCM10030269 TaxID=3273388 RepID=UPI00361AC34A